MDINLLDSIFELGNNLVERIWPDPIRRAEELRKLEELKQSGDLARLDARVKLLLGQLEINKIEAASKSLFVAGWRPFIGWVGGFALVYQFILYPLLIWVWAFSQAKGLLPTDLSPPPILETGALMSIVSAMLGIGAMRSFDKRNHVQTDKL